MKQLNASKSPKASAKVRFDDTAHDKHASYHVICDATHRNVRSWDETFDVEVDTVYRLIFDRQSEVMSRVHRSCNHTDVIYTTRSEEEDGSLLQIVSYAATIGKKKYIALTQQHMIKENTPGEFYVVHADTVYMQRGKNKSFQVDATYWLMQRSSVSSRLLITAAVANKKHKVGVFNNNKTRVDKIGHHVIKEYVKCLLGTLKTQRNTKTFLPLSDIEEKQSNATDFSDFSDDTLDGAHITLIDNNSEDELENEAEDEGYNEDIVVTDEVPEESRESVEKIDEANSTEVCPCREHAGTENVNKILDIDVDTLYTFLFEQHSPVMKEVYKKRKFFDIHYSPLIGSGDGSYTQTLSYVISMGGKKCTTVTVQNMEKTNRQGRFYVVHTTSSSSGIATIDSFDVHTKYCLTRKASNRSKLRITSEIAFKKQTVGILRKALTKSAENALEDYMKCMVEILDLRSGPEVTEVAVVLEEVEDKADSGVSSTNTSISEVFCPCHEKHEGEEICNEVIDIDVDTLYFHIFNQNSTVMPKVFAERKISNVKVTPVQTEADGSSSYVLSNSLYFGPTQVKAQHKITMLKGNQPGLFYVVTADTSSPDIPYGDSFYSRTTYCLTRVALNVSRLRVTTALHFNKSFASFVKNMITKRSNAALVGYISCVVEVIKSEPFEPRCADIKQQEETSDDHEQPEEPVICCAVTSDVEESLKSNIAEGITVPNKIKSTSDNVKKRAVTFSDTVNYEDSSDCSEIPDLNVSVVKDRNPCKRMPSWLSNERLNKCVDELYDQVYSDQTNSGRRRSPSEPRAEGSCTELYTTTVQQDGQWQLADDEDSDLLSGTPSMGVFKVHFVL